MSESTNKQIVNILPEEFEIICRCCLNKNGDIKLFVYHHEGILLRDIIMLLSLLHVCFIRIYLSKGFADILTAS